MLEMRSGARHPVTPNCVPPTPARPWRGRCSPLPAHKGRRASKRPWSLGPQWMFSEKGWVGRAGLRSRGRGLCSVPHPGPCVASGPQHSWGWGTFCPGGPDRPSRGIDTADCGAHSELLAHPHLWVSGWEPVRWTPSQGSSFLSATVPEGSRREQKALTFLICRVVHGHCGDSRT